MPFCLAFDRVANKGTLVIVVVIVPVVWDKGIGSTEVAAQWNQSLDKEKVITKNVLPIVYCPKNF